MFFYCVNDYRCMYQKKHGLMCEIIIVAVPAWYMVLQQDMHGSVLQRGMIKKDILCHFALLPLSSAGGSSVSRLFLIPP